MAPAVRHVCNEAAFAPCALPGSAALGNVVAAVFGRGHNAVIMENHGVVTAGTTLTDAFRCFETFEFAARAVIRARLLRWEIRSLSANQIALCRRTITTPAATLPCLEAPCSKSEKELRAVASELIRRAYRQRLFISTQGILSARLDDSAFLITPEHFDRSDVQLSDLVLVRDGQAENGKAPSSAASLHLSIYRRHTAIGAMINACPPNATAFSMTDAPLDTRTIPESYVVVRRVGRANYELQFEDIEALAARITPATPALLIQNDGVLVTGGSVLEAYDRLEVLESTADALIDCGHLENCRPCRTG